MATLELVVDATRAVSGSQQAEAALGRVKTAAEATSKAVSDSGARMSAAFQATGGTTQVAGGIAQTAKAFADLNVQAGLFNTSRVLLEIGKTAQDFREVAATMPKVTRPILETVNLFDSFGLKVGETTRVIGVATQSTSRLSTVFATLNTIMRANPLLLIASAIGAVAGAMSIFGSETQKAANAYDQLGNSFRKAQLDAKTAAYLGVPYKPDLAQQQRDVFSMVQQAQTSGQGINLRTLGEFGYGDMSAEYLESVGDPQQRRMMRQYRQFGGTARTTMVPVPGLGTSVPQTTVERGLPDVQLSASQTQEVLRLLNERLQRPPEAYSTGQTYGVGGALNQSMQVAMIAKRGLEIEREKAELAERQAESLRQASDYAANIGSTVGAAFADVLMKTTSVRQAFQQIVASIARQGLSDVGASIFRGVVGAVAGGTATQVKGNTGATPGGG